MPLDLDGLKCLCESFPVGEFALRSQIDSATAVLVGSELFGESSAQGPSVAEDRKILNLLVVWAVSEGHFGAAKVLADLGLPLNDDAAAVLRAVHLIR